MEPNRVSKRIIKIGRRKHEEGRKEEAVDLKKQEKTVEDMYECYGKK